MNAKILLTTLAIAAAASGAARAEGSESEYVVKFEGSRTRAEVMAEAATVSRTRSIEPAGSRVINPLQSSTDVQVVRAEAVQALRLGKIPSGEASL